MKILELFKGTGSVGKIAKKLGWEVMSVDIEDKYEPDILADILEWKYKKFFKDTGFIPDLVWASPPCNTYSPLVYPLKERDTKTAEPKSERARIGTEILYRTLRIIRYLQKKNPKLVYTIENPRGMMRHDKQIKLLPHRDTTLYCLYGDKRVKPTDFFNNVGLDLKQGTPSSCSSVGRIRVQGDTRNIEERYFIPPKLVKEILTKMAEHYKAQ